MDRKMTCLLIVEDNEQLIKMYKSAMEGEGIEIVVAKDAEEGRRLVEDKNPGLVLMDILLPGKESGLEVLKFMKANDNLRDIPVIMLTNVEEDYREAALQAGAEEYLVKADVDITDLVEKVKRYLQ